MFYVGQKVVCVDDSPKRFTESEEAHLCNEMDGLKVGVIYTIRWCGHFVHPVLSSYDEIKVCGIVRGREDIAYAASRFRPLQERKNDGEAFVRKLKEDCMPKEIERV